MSRLAARRFLRRALGLDSSYPNIGTALDRHGYIQIDPLNICGRMHDLILRNRVTGYREGDLMRYLHGDTAPLAPAERRAFEHHMPDSGILVAFPLEAWPHLAGAMHRRSITHGPWAGRLTPRERLLADQLLTEIRHRGPLGSEDFDDDRTARRVWGAAKLVKATLQKLFFHGRLLIAQRQHNRRRYDLPDRVLPANILAQAPATPEATKRWLASLKLRQRRLATLKREESRLMGDAVQPVVTEDGASFYCLRDDATALAQIDASPPARPLSSQVSLLAPLDPLIYDRRLTATLWNFDYTWEAYTPPLKRVRGHYALPVLVDTEIIGHVNPKAERTQGKLVVISRAIRRGHKLAPALQDLARWLGLRRR